MDKVYILFFNDYESNDVVGAFSTMEEAQRIRQLLIDYPPTDDHEQSGYLGSTLGYMAENRTAKEYQNRLGIATFTLDVLVDDVKLNNLQYLELKAKEKGI